MPTQEGTSLGRPEVPALSVAAANKTFAGVTVLDRVDLTVRSGSVHALLGHNGSGKSTLVKVLTGVYQPDRHTVARSFAHEFSLGDPVGSARVGLRVVHQDLGLIDSLSVVDNLAFGPGFPRNTWGTVAWAAARDRSRAALEALGYDIDVAAPVGSLSASERTGVAVARAMQDWAGVPRVLILDEPTATMPAPEVDRLFGAVRHLRDRGLGIIFVTHALEEALDLADDVTVLRQGTVVLTRPAAGLNRSDLVRAIVGHDLDDPAVAPTNEVPLAAPPVLTVEGLTTRRVQAASFTVRPGEIVGLAGILGSGRDEVLPALAGVTRRGGSVRVNGAPVKARRPAAAIKAGLGLVPARRREAALVPVLDAGQNLTLSGLARYTRFGLISERHERADAKNWFDRLGVVPRRPSAPILTLSGGNQQKVVVGRWLRRDPEVLTLDEPTQGVDVGASHTIYERLREAAASGTAVLVSSSESEELASICDRVLVFVSGEISRELAGADVTARQIDIACFNHGEANAS